MNALAAVARNIAPIAPWQNIGAPFAPRLVIVQLLAEGLYILFGSLQAASSSALIATLPSDASPPFETVGLAAMDGVPVPIRLLANGQVRLAAAPDGAVSALHVSILFYGN